MLNKTTKDCSKNGNKDFINYLNTYYNITNKLIEIYCKSF